MNGTVNESVKRHEMNRLLNFRLIISFFSLALILIGITGNTATFFLLRKPKKRLSTTVFLSALCVVAILALLGLLVNHALYGIFIYYEFLEGITVIMFYYPYIYPFINTFQMTSIWLTVSVSINQFLIVSRSQVNNNKTKETHKREIFTSVAVFILSSIYCIPYWMKFKYSPEFGIHVSKIGNNPIFIKVVHFYLYLPMAYIIPFIILTFTNAYLIATLKRKRERNNALDCVIKRTRDDSFKRHRPIKHNNEEIAKSERCSLMSEIRLASMTNLALNENKIKDSTFMLVAVVIFFLICHFPSLILHLIESFNEAKLKKNIYYFYMMELAKFLLIFNLAFNFAVFYLFSRHFRKFIKLK